MNQKEYLASWENLGNLNTERWKSPLIFGVHLENQRNTKRYDSMIDLNLLIL